MVTLFVWMCASAAVATLVSPLGAAASSSPLCSTQGIFHAYLIDGETFAADASLDSSNPYRAQCPGIPLAYSLQSVPPTHGDAVWHIDALSGQVSLTDTVGSGFAEATVTARCEAAPLCVWKYYIGFAEALTGAPTPAPTLTQTTTAAPTTNETTAATVAPTNRCRPVYGFDFTAGATNAGSLAGFAYATSCPTTPTASAVAAAPSYSGLSLQDGTSQNPTRTHNGVSLTLQPDGSFSYVAAATPTNDHFAFELRCDGVPLCRAVAYVATSMHALTAAPTASPPTPKPLEQCEPLYYEVHQHHDQTTMSMQVLQSLREQTGSRECDGLFSATLLAAPRYTDNFTLRSNGLFGYAPSTTRLGWDNFTFDATCAGDSAATSWECTETAYLLVSPPLTAAPGLTLAPPTDPPVGQYEGDRVTCRGSCNEGAWVTAHSTPDRWDTNEGVFLRADGRPVGELRASFVDGHIKLDAFGAIGNMAARFPTFEPVVATLDHDALRSSTLPSAVAVAFEPSCLDSPAPYGAGEQVWWWNSPTTLEGVVGDDYKSGDSYYQVFGGKHIGCDTFAAGTCSYAPLLQPKAPWSVLVDDCDTTWTATFNRTSLLAVRLSTGEAAFQRNWEPRYAALQQRRETLVMTGRVYSEGIKPRSWVQPALGVLTETSRHIDVSVVLEETLRAELTTQVGAAVSSWVVGDVDRFTYIGDDNSSMWAGYNMPLFPNPINGDTLPPVEALEVVQAAFDPVTGMLGGMDAACVGTKDCADESLPHVTVARGPACGGAAAPNGVSCVADSSNAAVNITIRIRLLRTRTTLVGMPYLPEGSIELAIFQRPATGGNATRTHTLRLSVGSALVGVADTYTPPPPPPGTTATGEVPASTTPSSGNATTVTPSTTAAPTRVPLPPLSALDVRVGACRGATWPPNPFVSDAEASATLRCNSPDEHVFGGDDVATYHFTRRSSNAAEVVEVRREEDGGTGEVETSVPVLRVVSAVLFGAVRPAAPLLLVNDSTMALSPETRRTAIAATDCATYLNVRRPNASSIAFTPATVCPVESPGCTLVLEVALVSAMGDVPTIVRRTLTVRPGLTAEVRSGTKATKEHFFSVIQREDGALKVGSRATSMALGVALVMVAAVYFVGAAFIYSSEDARAVVKEHGAVLAQYVDKITGGATAASKSAPSAAAPTGTRLPKEVVSPTTKAGASR